MNKTRFCNTCDYWVNYQGNDDLGECHRYAPRNSDREYMMGALCEIDWPLTKDDDFCGEYKRSE